MVQNKIIAVMGSPGSGKTTASIKLALELAAKKKNVILVFCDPFTPVIPFVVPCPEEQVSIGTLLTTHLQLTQKMILDSCIPTKESGYISLLGCIAQGQLNGIPTDRQRADSGFSGYACVIWLILSFWIVLTCLRQMFCR
ncbi:MAG: zeta toxin family protein [Hungatella sp.]|uniref:zeta toxin family protein n=1 Tax=Hungatella sp. TaxID=2613924 RepID=UPI0039954DB6